MIKAVIFDLDGLLIDSETWWGKADVELLGRRGFIPTEELFIRRLGTGNRKTVEIYKEEFDIKEDIEELIKERLEIYFDLLDKNLCLMEGAFDLITRLKSEGKLLAIATSGPYADRIEKMMKKLNIFEYFSAFVTGEEVKNPKPFPDIFLVAAGNLGISSNQCLVMEDAPSGIKAARAAGMKAYGINKNKQIRDKLKEALADAVFTSLNEIKI